MKMLRTFNILCATLSRWKEKCLKCFFSFLVFGLFLRFGVWWFRAVVTQTTIGGLYGLLEDILALLPQDEIFILFFEKLDSSIEFSNMVESIGSQEFGMKFDSLKVHTHRHTYKNCQAIA